MKAAVLTVSDGVVGGRARGRRAATLLDELLAADGYEVERRRRPGRARRRSRRRSRELADDARARPHDRRHRGRAARRDARGDASACSTARRPGIAEAIRADSIAKTPHGLLVARRRRRRAAARSSSTCPARPAAAATASPLLQPALDARARLLAGEATAHRQT